MIDTEKPEQPEAPSSEAPAADPAEGHSALVEPPTAAVTRLEEELAALKDRHLRVAAEYDNFRKRTVRERGELWAKAQVELVTRLIDALDDLARFAHVDPAETDAKTLHDGIDMVERKVWKELQVMGISRIDEVGVPFDPKLHEAVTTAPAPDETKDHTVGAIFQAGYRLNETLIRAAKVLVLTWTGEGEAC